jgi:hypothetical protein
MGRNTCVLLALWQPFSCYFTDDVPINLTSRLHLSRKWDVRDQNKEAFFFLSIISFRYRCNCLGWLSFVISRQRSEYPFYLRAFFESICFHFFPCVLFSSFLSVGRPSKDSLSGRGCKSVRQIKIHFCRV